MIRLSGFERMLYAFIAFTILLVAGRVWYFGSGHFVFLLVNIFLAWIPYGLGKWLVQVRRLWQRWLLFAAWLLFLPNAFYIVTDLLHLRPTLQAPLWYDMLLLFSAALNGLVLAFASLYQVEHLLRQYFSRQQVLCMVWGILTLASFGVYLGRYLRWYSWDIIARPGALLQSVADRLFFPQQHLRTWGMTAVLTVLFSLLYFTGKTIPEAAFPDTKKTGT